LKRSWGGEVRNVSLLVAIGVNDEGYREVLAAAEGSKEDKASWTAFLHWRRCGSGARCTFIARLDRGAYQQSERSSGHVKA